MLILTRKSNETIIVGDNVRVTVLAIEGSQVRLGIEAPRTISIFRGEIYQRIKDENRAIQEHEVAKSDSSPKPSVGTNEKGNGG